MFGGCRDKVVGLRHLWSGPDGAGIMSSSLWIKGGTWGAGCSAQWAEDALPGEKVLTEGTRASAQDRRCRKEKDSRALCTWREKCLTSITLYHLEGVSGARQPGSNPTSTAYLLCDFRQVT